MAKAPEELRFATIATDAVVFAVFDNVLHVLTISVDRPPHYKGVRGLPGGMVLEEETAEESIERHLRNKCGVSGVYTEQLYTFSALNRDPRSRVVSVAYLCLLDESTARTVSPEQAEWVPLRRVGKLAFDHNEILNTGIERLRGKFEYTNIAQHLLPSRFTLTELQSLYEVVLGTTLDKRNFRKKILAIDLVKETNERQQGVRNRPAILYRFSKKQPIILPILG